jgi:hypothetical protein
MDKNKLIIINGFPNTEKKVQLIESQISYLKKLKHPILLISGCSASESLLSKVDYFILNTENEVIGKDFVKQCFDSSNPNVVYNKFLAFDNQAEFALFDTNVNSTITKNIKLAFTIAKTLGYTSVFYTEDDNIFKDGALFYIENYLNLIESKEYNLATIVGREDNVVYPILFTTFFFANVDFMLENFNIPTEAKDWYIEENIYKYGLSKTYEGAFYHIMEPHINSICNIEEDFTYLVKENHIEWGKHQRYHNEHRLLEVFFNIVPDSTKQNHLILFNQSNWLLEGEKSYDIIVYHDSEFIIKVNLPKAHHYFTFIVPPEVREVKLEIENYGVKILDNSLESTQYNGKLTIF